MSVVSAHPCLGDPKGPQTHAPNGERGILQITVGDDGKAHITISIVAPARSRRHSATHCVGFS